MPMSVFKVMSIQWKIFPRFSYNFDFSNIKLIPFFDFFLIKVQLIHNVNFCYTAAAATAAAAAKLLQSCPTTAKLFNYIYIYIYVYFLFYILFHYGLSQDFEYSSLC